MGANRFPSATLAVVALVLFLPVATADGRGDVDPPRGFEFCGWKDLVDGGWTYDDPEPGAYLRLFARKMSCRTARRKYRQVRYEQEPPYRPRLRGYRCKTLDRSWEYADVRCSKRGHPNVSVRWQTGA